MLAPLADRIEMLVTALDSVGERAHRVHHDLETDGAEAHLVAALGTAAQELDEVRERFGSTVSASVESVRSA